MPKIRTIKPEFWVDSDLAEITVWARCFYIGLWNFADDEGIFEWKPKQLKVQIFPYDDVNAYTLLEELITIGKIRKFTNNNKEFGIIPNFCKHQKIDERYKREFIKGLDKDKIEYHSVDPPLPRRDNVQEGEVGGRGKGREVDISDAKASVSSSEDPHVEIVALMEDEFRKFLPFASKVLGCEKKFTAEGLKKWSSRRKKFTAKELAEAFYNLQNEPDQWKILNLSQKQLSWWLRNDDYIREMQNCHLKRSSKTAVFIS